MLAIRMTRHGAKKRPFFHIVVADSRSPRDGRFIEKLGTYNPLLPREHAQRITLDKERIAHWLKVGAQPSDRVAKFLAQAEMMKPRERREQTKKPQPRAKAQERMKARRRRRAAAGRKRRARRPRRADEATDRVLLGVVAAPHGVRGLVRIKSFTEDPMAIAAYGPLSDETGKKRVPGRGPQRRTRRGAGPDRGRSRSHGGRGDCADCGSMWSAARCRRRASGSGTRPT